MKKNHQQYHGVCQHSNGFTLIEVMVVIVLIGLMASVIQFTVVGNSPEEKLKQESTRFAGIFDVAAEYSLLNNVELGLLIDTTSYQFLGFDGVRWSSVSESEILTAYNLPEGIEITIQLEDLPIEEPQLFDSISFASINDEDDLLEYENQDEEKKIIPQVYILSGGDITPFSLTFAFDETTYLEEPVSYKVIGLYSTPLSVEGPLFDEQ